MQFIMYVLYRINVIKSNHYKVLFFSVLTQQKSIRLFECLLGKMFQDA